MPAFECSAEEVRLGIDLNCGERLICHGIGGAMESIEIGDHVTIGDDVRILARRVKIGDWVTIHNHTTIYGYEDVEIGECSWIGQNVILNCTAPLRIGRGCTISAYSNLWTHFSGGDTLQGCRFGADHDRPCTLEDDVWIGVGASVAPVQIGAQALVLAGAIITKDIPRNTVWGGNPAVDLTAKLGAPYEQRGLADKFAELGELLRDFRTGDLRTPAPALSHDGGCLSSGGIVLCAVDIDIAELEAQGYSVFDLRDRTYSKIDSPDEQGFMRYLLPTIKFWARHRA